MHTDTAVIAAPTQLTAEWLTSVLGPTVADFDTERIGTGQMSECYRVTLRYADENASGPESVVIKVAAADPVSRQTGVALGLYEREVRFYTDIAPKLDGPIARCHHAAINTDEGVFDIVLGDAGPAIQGDEITGATQDEALLSIIELARLHGPVLGDPALAQADWLNREAPVNQALIATLWAGFADRYADRITAAQRDVCERLVGSFDAYLAAAAEGDYPQGLVHGDYRLDNLLFGQPGADRLLTVVDWQTVTWGHALTDVAYFLGCALDPAVRRAHQDDLLAAYHTGLGPNAPISLDDVRAGVRQQSFFGVMMAIVSSMLVERTERGDEMFMTMLERHCSQVLDTDALELLPSAVAAEPLSPSPDDEGGHAAGDETLWSESWYADFADVDAGVGGWFRLGLQPNQGAAWVSAFVCGPDLPTIALLDFEAPVSAHEVTTDAYRLTHGAVDPLHTYRVQLTGRGFAHDDPAALLRGETGRPVELSMDLTWTTAGAPYMYRITTRYEIPCTVSGTVTADGRTYVVDAVAGQRDHSWGVRDWWGMQWMWSALHLQDGTHVHAIDLRVPTLPRIGIGYEQSAGSPMTELDTVGAEETFGDDGLPGSATITTAPGGLELTLDIRGHAPMRLEAADGAVSYFPRAWATVTTADGRTGVGWVEWNRRPD